MFREGRPSDLLGLCCMLVDATASEIIAEANARDVAYDDETMHGETMGAVFP